MGYNSHDITEPNGNALFRMWRSWEDEWLNFPSKERQDQIYMTVEQDTIENKRRDLRFRWACWTAFFIVPMLLGFSEVAIAIGAVGVACEVFMACVAGNAYHPSGGADQFGVMGWLFGMVLAVIAYLLMVGLIALFINETKIILIGLASLVGLVVFFLGLNVASDWGCERLQKIYDYFKR